MANYYLDGNGNLVESGKKKKKKGKNYILQADGTLGEMTRQESDNSTVGTMKTGYTNIRSLAEENVRKKYGSYEQFVDRNEKRISAGMLPSAMNTMNKGTYTRLIDEEEKRLSSNSEFYGMTNETYRKYLDNFQENATDEKQKDWLLKQKKNLSVLADEKVRSAVADYVKGSNNFLEYMAKHDGEYALKQMGYSVEEIKSMADTYQREQNAKHNENMMNIADDLTDKGILGKISASILGLGAGVASAPGIIGDMFTELKQSASGEYAPRDTYKFTDMASNLKSRVTENIHNDITGAEDYAAQGKETPILREAAGVLYDAGQAAAESLLLGPLKGGLAIMAGQAATDAANDAFERTGSNKKALATGLASGGIEAVTEKVSLDNLWDIMKNSGKAAYRKALVNILVQSGIEGTEEMTSEALNTVADSIINQTDSNLSKNVEKYKDDGKSEKEAWELALTDVLKQVGNAGLVGALSGGIGASVASVVSPKMSKNEQRVVDTETENRIRKEQENGRKLSAKEKAGIREKVEEDFAKGRISIDTIESALGGETYKAYEELSKEAEEFHTLNQIRAGELTGEQSDRLAELKEKNRKKSYESALQEMKEKLSVEVDEFTKDDFLIRESYNEKARRSQAFEADIEKYDKKQQEVIKKAVESGILNNTNRTHEFVDMIAKISSDKGISFDFTDNQRLRESGFEMEGKTVNGYVKDGNVTLNINSAKALNAVVGHEITHVLEGTEHYDALKEALFSYAKTKNEYQTRYDAVKELYKGIDNADIEKEFAADLVGDYLFNDESFVQNLSTEHPNIFKQIYEEIKYLVKSATSGSKEERQLLKARKVFEEAYRENGKTSEETKFSVTEGMKDSDRYNELKNKQIAIASTKENELLDGYDLEGKRLNDIYKFVKENREILGLNKTYQKEDIQLEFGYSNRGIKKSIRKTADNNIDEREYLDVLSCLDEIIDSSVLIERHGDKVGKENSQLKQVYVLLGAYQKNSVITPVQLEIKENVGTDNQLYLAVTIKKSRVNDTASAEAASASIQDFSNISIQDLVEKINPDAVDFLKYIPTEFLSSEQIKGKMEGMRRDINKYPNSSLKKELEEIEKNTATRKYSITVDNQGTTLTEKQMQHFKNAKTVDEQGRLKRYYHGTARGDRVGTYFDPKRATSGPMAFFTDSKEIATNYSRDKEDTSIAYESEYDSYETQFRVERDGEDMSIIDLWYTLSPRERAEIKEKGKHITFDYSGDYGVIYDEEETHGLGNYDDYEFKMHRGNALSVLVDSWLNGGNIFGQEEMFLDVLRLVGIEDARYMNPDYREEKVYETYLNITNPFDTSDVDEEFLADIYDWLDATDLSYYEKESANADMWDKNNIDPYDWAERIRDDIESGTTHAWTSIPDVITDFLKSQGYDGIFDSGGKNGGAVHQVVIPFYSAQIKEVTNLNPTDNPHINMSLSEKGQQDIAPEKSGAAPNKGWQVSGKDLAIAPIGENVKRKTNKESVVPDGFPIREDIAPAQKTKQDDLEDGPFYPSDTSDQDATEMDYSKQSQEKIKNIRAKIQGFQMTKEIAVQEFDAAIKKKTEEYESLKRKDTKKAAKIMEQIGEISGRKEEAIANFDKKIKNHENAIENVEKMERAKQAQKKRTGYMEWAKELIGDTTHWKDKRFGLQYMTNTLKRNLRDIVRDADGKQDLKKADEIHDALHGEYGRNEARLNREANEIKRVFREMKINRTESTYIQMLGEYRYNPDCKITPEEMSEFYEKNRQKIDTEKVEKALQEARPLYDSLFQRVNEVLRENGMKEIGYRKGYFPHFTEDQQSVLGKLLNWKTRNDTIPTDIAGLTENFKPNRTYQSFDKHRTGDSTDYNFLKGLDTYVNGALDWIYHIEDIQKRRAIENAIRYEHSEKGVQEQIQKIQNNPMLDADEMQEQIDAVYAKYKNPLNNFVQDFRNATNNLAGKKSSMDRGLEYATSRKIYSVMTNVSNRVSANMIAGSVSSALTNFIPISQSWVMVNPIYTARAMKSTVQSYIKDDGVIGMSTFLTNRLNQNEMLHKTTWDKVSEKAGLLMESVDRFTSQVVWRSKYMQNLQKGMTTEQAVLDADQFAEGLMAGRSRGDMPTIFNSKSPIIKLFTAFQLEQNNQFQFMFKDAPQEVKNGNATVMKLAAGYTMATIGSHLYNVLYSMLTGRDSALDPIGTLLEFLKDLGVIGDDDEEDENAVDKVTTAVGNLAENIAQEVPFIGGMLGGGRIPISAAIPYGNPMEAISETYGGISKIASAVSNGEDLPESTVKELQNEWKKVLFYGVMPMAGGQMKKTAEGLSMFNKDIPVSGSYTNSGKLRFPVKDTTKNRIQAAVFGQYANENAREYFDGGNEPLNEKQIEEYKELDIPIADYWKIRKGMKGLEKNEEKADYVSGLKLPVSKKNILINNAISRKDKIDMDGYEKYEDWEEFDYSQKNPGKYMIAKAAGGYKNFKMSSMIMGEIKADKDENGKPVSGSRKEKIINYINNCDAEYGQKLIMFKNEYPSDDTYNGEIVSYLNGREDLSYSDVETILKELGFEVKKDGTVRW